MAHRAHGIALRLVGVLIATCGVALLGFGTFTSPLSGGHFKLAGTPVLSTSETGCDDEDECGSCVTTSRTPEVDGAIFGPPEAFLPFTSRSDDGEDEDGGCSTTTTSHTTSTAPSGCRTPEVAAAAVTTCTTSTSKSSSSAASSSAVSSSAASSSAGSSSSASTATTTHSSTSTSAGVLGASTSTPSTGSDLAFGLGLIFLIGGGGLVAGGSRYGRRRKRLNRH